MSYTRSESIAADWNEACIRGDNSQGAMARNGLGMLGMAAVTAKAADGEEMESQAKAARDCVTAKKSDLFGMAETNIHLNSSPPKMP